MASRAVVAAIKARVEANWTTLPLFGPNQRMGRPADASSFVDMEFPVSNSEQITVGAPGANVHREEGVFRLLIAAKRNTGVDQVLTWADELSALFRAKTFAGMQTFSPSPPTLDESNDNGAYFVVAIAVPYEFDIFG
jgi:hypothetical protein